MEESEHSALAGVEFGFEGLKEASVLVEVVAGEVGEDVEDAGGAGCGAVAVFGVESDCRDAGRGHGGPDLAFDEGMDEQGQEVAAQQCFDADGAVQVDGGDSLGAFSAWKHRSGSWRRCDRPKGLAGVSVVLGTAGVARGVRSSWLCGLSAPVSVFGGGAPSRRRVR